MDGACSCRKKIRPYGSGFPLGCWDHSTFSVKCDQSSLMYRDPEVCLMKVSMLLKYECLYNVGVL